METTDYNLECITIIFFDLGFVFFQKKTNIDREIIQAYCVHGQVEALLSHGIGRIRLLLPRSSLVAYWHDIYEQIWNVFQ